MVGKAEKGLEALLSLVDPSPLTSQTRLALPYVTDWAYASSENDCNTKIDKSSTYKCKNNNWMQRSTWAWYLSPFAGPDDAYYVWSVFGDGSADCSFAANPLSAFPTIYLKSNVLIDSGKGTSSDPYILKAGL